MTEAPAKLPSIGSVPQSSALAEARIDSISDAIDRFDRHIVAGTVRSAEARRDLGRIVDEMIEQRQRWEAAEKSKPLRAKAAAPAVVNRSMDDLGL